MALATVAAGAPVRASTINGIVGAINGAVTTAGTVTITPSAANTPTSIAVSFPAAYTSTPTVQVTANTTAPGTVVTGVSVSNVTTTGCTVWLTRTTVFATPVNWTAFGS